jgi:hypothetical protein
MRTEQLISFRRCLTQGRFYGKRSGQKIGEDALACSRERRHLAQAFVALRRDFAQRIFDPAILFHFIHQIS